MRTLVDPTLSMWAETVDDLERTRIALAGRLRVMIGTDPDDDGEMRCLALPLDGPDARAMREAMVCAQAAEREAVRRLESAMRGHPLGEWVTATCGIGHKTVARLLAVVGDPYLMPDGRPRTVSQLWAYCGYHVLDGAAPRLTRGVRANWSHAARARAYVVAERTTLQRKSPYRATYEQRRAVTAAFRQDWTPAHAHADAIRVVAKRILRDLWIQAKAWHES